MQVGLFLMLWPHWGRMLFFCQFLVENSARQSVRIWQNYGQEFRYFVLRANISSDILAQEAKFCRKYFDKIWFFGSLFSNQKKLKCKMLSDVRKIRTQFWSVEILPYKSFTGLKQILSRSVSVIFSLQNSDWKILKKWQKTKFCTNVASASK